jgi:hypothetical protein
MKVIGPVTEVYGAPRLVIQRKVEKPNASSGLGRETRPAQAPIMLNRAPAEETQPCRFETAAATTELAAAIPAPFVAQIIGQVLETKRADFAAALRAFKANDEWRMARNYSVVA